MRRAAAAASYWFRMQVADEKGADRREAAESKAGALPTRSVQSEWGRCAEGGGFIQGR